MYPRTKAIFAFVLIRDNKITLFFRCCQDEVGVLKSHQSPVQLWPLISTSSLVQMVKEKRTHFKVTRQIDVITCITSQATVNHKYLFVLFTFIDFSRKVWRGKLAIAITANFVNRNTPAEMQIREIGGVAFIFNQDFFKNLRMKCGVELENFVYYKDDTHYFVMTVKKQSLLKKGILKEDRPNARDLLAPDNRDNSKLKQFALEIADVTTKHRIPNITFEVNHHGEEDIAMFDFTSMSMANHSCFVKKRHDHTLIQAIVGDSLLEVKLSNFP